MHFYLDIDFYGYGVCYGNLTKVLSLKMPCLRSTCKGKFSLFGNLLKQAHAYPAKSCSLNNKALTRSEDPEDEVAMSGLFLPV